MNRIISYITISVLSFAMFFSSCTDGTDVMTGNVQVGGLVKPLTVNIPYKLNATSSFDVNVLVPIGPAIEKVELYKKYTVNDTTVSNSALLATLNVGSKNLTESFSGKVSLNYASLISTLTVGGKPMPANEALLNIGEFWTISYVAILADGRKVSNSATTNIAVANAYAGAYSCVGTFTHPVNGPRPINEEKFLTPLSASTCNIPVGDLGGSGYFVDITVDPVTNTVTFSNGVPAAIIASAARSYYEPSTGKFYLNYYYVGGTGNRVISEVYTPKP